MHILIKKNNYKWECIHSVQEFCWRVFPLTDFLSEFILNLIAINALILLLLLWCFKLKQVLSLPKSLSLLGSISKSEQLLTCRVYWVLPSVSVLSVFRRTKVDLLDLGGQNYFTAYFDFKSYTVKPLKSNSHWPGKIMRAIEIST